MRWWRCSRLGWTPVPALSRQYVKLCDVRDFHDRHLLAMIQSLIPERDPLAHVERKVWEYGMLMLFMRDADSQGFTPRYGMTDSDDTTTLGQYGPRNQTQNIVGVGALPISNVAVNQYPTTATELIPRSRNQRATRRASSSSNGVSTSPR